MNPSAIPTQHTAVIHHLDLWLAVAIVPATFIVAAIYWLWKRYRVRRPKDPK